MFYTNEEKECIRECISYIKESGDQDDREKTIFNNKSLDEIEATLSKDIVPNKDISISIKFLLDAIIMSSWGKSDVDIIDKYDCYIKSTYNKSLTIFNTLNII